MVDDGWFVVGGVGGGGKCRDASREGAVVVKREAARADHLKFISVSG